MRYQGAIKRIMLTVPLFGLFMATAPAAHAGFGLWVTSGWNDHGRDYYKHDRHHRHDYYYRHHHRPYYGRSVLYLPHRSVTIVIGGGRYYYGDGYFYRRRAHAHDYEIVAPPVGAVIYTLPSGCRSRVIAGVSYYVHDDIYYRKSARGYEVVEPPEEEVEVTYAAPSAKPQDSFNVNIPNANGGFTTVTVKRSGQGFVGPQGEYYSEFPSVEALRVMYAK